MMEERKTAAKSASSIFFEDYNDIDIYIEDKAPGYRKIFKELINKVLGSQYSIEQVFPIGNRNEVIAECEKYQSYTGRKRVYIVDGDFYLLNNNDRKDLKGLFVLPRYCIENFLIDQYAIAQVAYEEVPELEVEKILTALNFNEWIEENEENLIELYVIYAICNRYIPQEQTVGYKVSSLCSSNQGVVCPVKIENRVSYLKEKLITFIGEQKLEAEINKIKSGISQNNEKLLHYVSGKDYLFPLLIARLQSFLKFSPNYLNLKIRLAMKCEADELKNIMNYIFE